MRLWILALALSLACSASARPASVTRAGDEITIGNDYLARTISVANAKLRTVRLYNKLSGEKLPVRGPEFALTLRLDSKDVHFTSDAFTPREPRHERAGDAVRLLVECAAEQPPGLRVAVEYLLGDNDWFLRKRLTASTLHGRPLLLRLDVEQLQLGGEPKVKGGLGKPIYLGSSFFGLEYPAGYQTFHDGIVELSHFPGRNLPPASSSAQPPLTSKPAVWGVAPSPDQVSDAFLRYVDRIRPNADQPLRHMIVEKLFLVGKRFTCDEYLAVAQAFDQNLLQPYGVCFDALNVWNYYLHGPGIFQWDKKKYPEGFAPLTKKLKAMHRDIGIWFSFYTHESQNTKWGLERGYEVSGDPERGWQGSRYCLAGPKYYQACRKRVTDLVRENNVGFMHLDFNSWSCRETGHGHLPGPPYDREALVDAEIRLIGELRRIRPDIFLMMGCGSYKSPWWLMYFDVIWAGLGGDTGLCKVPTPCPRDNEITLRDIHFRRRFLEDGDVIFPSWGFWTHEPLFNWGEAAGRAARLNHLDIQDKWEDNIVFDMCRGTRCWAAHFDPELLSAREGNWRWLAAAIKWSKAHHPMMTRTQLIGGDPARGQLYGYAHVSADGRRAVIALHNPVLDAQSLRLDPRKLGLRLPRMSIRMLYPYRELLYPDWPPAISPKLEVPGMQVSVIELGEKAAGTRPTPPPHVIAAPLEPFTARAEQNRIVGDARFVLKDATADLYLLLEPEGVLRQRPKAEFTLNGKPLEVKPISYAPTTSGHTTIVPAPFLFYRADNVPAGRLHFTLDFGGPFFSTRLRTWLRLKQSLPTPPLSATDARGSVLLPPHEWRDCRIQTRLLCDMQVKGSREPLRVRCSSMWPQGDHRPENALDGNPNTFWTSRTNQNEWLEIDLGTQRQVAGLNIHWYAPWKAGHYKLQAWQDEHWVDCADKQNPDGRGDEVRNFHTKDSFNPIRTRKVRILVLTVNPGSANTAIREVEILTPQAP